MFAKLRCHFDRFFGDSPKVLSCYVFAALLRQVLQHNGMTVFFDYFLSFCANPLTKTLIPFSKIFGLLSNRNNRTVKALVTLMVAKTALVRKKSHPGH